jgi:hypothetical protein
MLDLHFIAGMYTTTALMTGKYVKGLLQKDGFSQGSAFLISIPIGALWPIFLIVASFIKDTKKR